MFGGHNETAVSTYEERAVTRALPQGDLIWNRARVGYGPLLATKCWWIPSSAGQHLAARGYCCVAVGAAHGRAVMVNGGRCSDLRQARLQKWGTVHVM